MMKCPVCEKEKVRTTRAEGFLEEKVYRLAFVRPFRCRNCRARFYGFSLKNGASAPRRNRRRKKRSDQSSTFMKGKDDQEFEQLIQAIRKEERKVFGEGKD